MKKQFKVGDNRYFLLRAEGFNVFNHTQWSGVNSKITCYGGTDNSAGDPSCINNPNSPDNFLHPNGAHNPRILQVAAKFVF